MHDTSQPAARQNIRLQLAAKPEEVALARALLRGVGETAGIDVQQMDEVRTAVSEACNNVVQHAYDGRTGPIELDVALLRDALEVTVRDHGRGMPTLARPGESDTLGIGLMVITALCEHAELSAGPESGLEVRMRFSAPGQEGLDPGGELPWPVEAAGAAESAGPDGPGIAVAIGPVSLARHVLPRLLTAMAMRSHFSTDRISDLQLVGEAIAEHAEPLIDGAHLCMRISASPRTVTQSIWPLCGGGAARLLAASCGAIERLGSEWEIRKEGARERLIVSLRDER
jgi:serine/threonine-protein kinase RsbW